MTLTPRRTTRRGMRGAIAALCAAVLVVSGCGAEPDPAPPPTSTPTPTPTQTPTPTPPPLPTPPVVGDRTELSQGLPAPWSLAFAGEVALVSGRDDALIRERLSDGSLREVGHIPGVRHGGEGGLLGIATWPTDAAVTHLYIYSTGDSGNRVQRFPLTGEAGSYGLGAAESVIDGLPAGWSHNGGRLAFGPDEMLYITVGDAGDTSHSQNLDSTGGKILRVEPDGAIPGSNPFTGSAVWSYGHRNVQGITWGDDGTMYASEFGQDTWDELNVITAGANYGWPVVEGIADAADYVDPVQQWRPADASPSGIAHVRGMLFIANLRGSSIRTVPVSDLGSSEVLYAGEIGRIRDVVAAPAGDSVWFVSNNTDGRVAPNPGDDRIYRIDLSGTG